jgi:hypothetical protein
VTPCCTPPCHTKARDAWSVRHAPPLDYPAQSVKRVPLPVHTLHCGHLLKIVRFQECACLKRQSETRHVRGSGTENSSRDRRLSSCSLGTLKNFRERLLRELREHSRRSVLRAVSGSSSNVAGACVQKSTARDPRPGHDRTRDLYAMMTPLTLYLTRAQSAHEQPCAVCGAEFVPAEDSGSRLLSLMPADREPLSVLMCGGCHSKWSHGVTVTARWGSESPVVPVLRHPGGG